MRLPRVLCFRSSDSELVATVAASYVLRRSVSLQSGGVGVGAIQSTKGGAYCLSDASVCLKITEILK